MTRVNNAPSARTIHSAFRRAGVAAPYASALICQDRSVTYGELDRRSNQFARFLRQQGVSARAKVCVQLGRSVETVISLLGILKAGAAFVPLDPQASIVQLAQALSDSEPRLLLTGARTADRCKPGVASPAPTIDIQRACIEAQQQSPDPFPGEDDPESLAYVMYTSGSTGRPKGVMVPHRAVVGLVVDNPYASFGPSETFLSLAPLTFDASTFEIWGALLNGGRLAIVPNPAPSLSDIGEAIAAHGVTTLWMTAGLFHLMVDERLDALRPLRQLVVGGDVLSRPHVERVVRAMPGCRLINGYGPTENTTFTCCFTITPENLGPGSVPIGNPIARREAHVLDDAMCPVPDGVLGELCVGGEGLALGYLNLPDQTASRFVRHPFDARPGACLYRTGDLVRRRADGKLEFAGRADRQVKVNGYRIELDAVELAIRQIPGVVNAAVLARSHGAAGARTTAFLVLSDSSAAGEAAFRVHLRELPAPMRPASTVVLDRLPLTPNGKVDREALSALAVPPPVVPGRMPPADETERALAEIWSGCLNRQIVEVDVNFFDLGGTSLELLRVQAEAARRLGVRIDIMRLFEFPTIRALARQLRNQHIPDHAAHAAPTAVAERSSANRQRLRDARQGAMR